MLVGEALSSLRDEGVLIFGSGSLTHSFKEMQAPHSPTPTWASEFVDWVTQTLTTARAAAEVKEDMSRIMQRAPHARRAHPREEHLIPLNVAVGAGVIDDTSGCERLYHEFVVGSLALTCYMWH